MWRVEPRTADGSPRKVSSGLSVLDFMKRSSILKCGADQVCGARAGGHDAGAAEGLEAHSRSGRMRFNLRD